MVRIHSDESLIALRRVDVALFLEEQVTEVLVDDVAVRGAAAATEKIADALCTLHVRKVDAQHAERVVDELSLGAAQCLQSPL